MMKKRTAVRYTRRAFVNRRRVVARGSARYRAHFGSGNNNDHREELNNLKKLLEKYTEENENLYKVLRAKISLTMPPPLPPVPPIIKTSCKSSTIQAEIVKVKLAITDQVLYQNKWKDDDDKKEGMMVSH